MKLPNKVISYNESILSLFPILLFSLQKSASSILQLYEQVKSKNKDVNDFLVALDCLYALNKISFNDTNGRLYYVV